MSDAMGLLIEDADNTASHVYHQGVQARVSLHQVLATCYTMGFEQGLYLGVAHRPEAERMLADMDAMFDEQSAAGVAPPTSARIAERDQFTQPYLEALRR